MIYTCTVNPSLDYYLKIENEFKLGEINRLDSEKYAAGGKGVNVSIVLNNLMIPSVTIGFLGGFTREYYLSYLKEYTYIMPLFTQIEGNTRINIKLSYKGDNGLNKEMDLNAHGPKISDNEFEKFKKRIERIDNGDIFVLSGNVQEELFEKMVTILSDLSSRGVKIILDTNYTLIRECLTLKPLLIRPNMEDMEELCDITIHSEDDLVKAGAALVEAGAKNVLLSLGLDGALLVCESGAFHSDHIKGNIVSTTGADDAMVAAYVFDLQRGADEFEAFRYACAAGAATEFKSGLATRNEIEECYKLVKIERKTINL